MARSRSVDREARRVRALLRRSMVTSLLGSLGIVGAVGSGVLTALGHEVGAFGAYAWPGMAVACLAAAVLAGVLSHRDNREAVEYALRRRRPDLLGAEQPEPFLSRDRG